MKPVIIKSSEQNNNPQFIKTKKIIFERDGKEFAWEMVERHDSVHILVNNTETKELIMVKQVRIPVLVNDNSQNGEVYEMCAGLVDKDKDSFQISKEEIEEEMGYCVDKEKIEYIRCLKSGVGSSGNNSHAFYVEVNESEKVSEGGGLEDEDIEVIRIKYEDLNDFITGEVHTDAMTMFLVMYAKAIKNV